MKTFNEHCECGSESKLVEDNPYRVGSERYFEYWREKREQYQNGDIEVQPNEVDIMESNLGEFAEFNGEHVALDCIFEEEKQPELNKPKAGDRRSTTCTSRIHLLVTLRKCHGVIRLDSRSS